MINHSCNVKCNDPDTNLDVPEEENTVGHILNQMQYPSNRTGWRPVTCFKILVKLMLLVLTAVGA